MEATGDDYRLVRVRAAASLAGYQDLPLKDDGQEKSRGRKQGVPGFNPVTAGPVGIPLQSWAITTSIAVISSRQLLRMRQALKMEPHGVLAMVNQAMAYARMGENQKANDALQKALKVAPDNAAANFNMGLLKAEENDLVSSGEASESSPQSRSSDGSGRLQPLRDSLERPSR